MQEHWVGKKAKKHTVQIKLTLPLINHERPYHPKNSRLILNDAVTFLASGMSLLDRSLQ